MIPTDPTKLNWETRPEEDITVSETHSDTMPGVNFTLDGAPVPTPSHTFKMANSGTRILTVTAHFSGTPEERCVVTVTGSDGGGSTKILRQPATSNFDQIHYTFTVENG